MTEDEVLLRETIRKIRPADPVMKEKAWAHWDSLCKPLRGFGRLEEMIVRLAGVQRTDRPHLSRRAAVIMGADNGVVAEGISQCSSDVTLQVLNNMGEGISSVCVMSRILNLDVLPVNIGMNSNARHPRVRNIPVRFGTGNIAQGPAMTREECISGIAAGIRMADECTQEGYDLIITGEMGIGNTTTSAACACALFGAAPETVTGRGAGLSGEGLSRKIRVVEKALEVNELDASHPENRRDPLLICSRVGGLDIAGMTGCFLGGAANGTAVWIDGVISGISACLAAMLCPEAVDYMFATHATSEPAGKLIMERLGLEPVLYAGMHLGEGTGAAAVLPLADQALNVYYGLPRFAEGNVEPYQHLK